MSDFVEVVDVEGCNDEFNTESEVFGFTFFGEPMEGFQSPNHSSLQESPNASSSLVDLKDSPTSSFTRCTKGPSSRTPKKNVWTTMEKDMFEKALDLFGPSFKKISNFLSSKSPSQVRSYYYKWLENPSLQETDSFLKGQSAGVSVELPLHLENLSTPSSSLFPGNSPPFMSSVLDNIWPSKDCLLSSINTTDVVEPRISMDDIFISYDNDWGGVGSQVCVVDNSKKAPSPLKRDTAIKRKLTKSKNPKVSVTKLKKKKRKKIPVKTKSATLQQPGDKSEFASNSDLSLSEGQVIKLSRTGDEESDVDIGDSDEDLVICDNDARPSNQKIPEVPGSQSCHPVKHSIDTSKDEIYYFSSPTEELYMDYSEVSEEEADIFFKHICGKSSERYVKIRNYIIKYWKSVKPKYVRKTAIRAGLKNCGNVNLLGKVHEYLEKKGAINFGCEESNYIDPLSFNAKKNSQVYSQRAAAYNCMMNINLNNRKQKAQLEGGGSTVCHGKDGSILNVVHIPEPPKVKKTASKQSQFKLNKCLEYDSHSKPPFSVVLYLEALTILELHSHMSLCEVMGLLGGYYDRGKGIVHVRLVIPTVSTSTGVECDMCPVSQREAMLRIEKSGYSVLGWYHSHPTFSPDPSCQDIQTQFDMQNWFSRQGLPFIGIIISSFSPTNPTEASLIRCMVLEQDYSEERSTKPVPFRLRWKVPSHASVSVEMLASEIQSLIHSERENELVVKWQKEWKNSVTYWEKAILSLRHHMPSQLEGYIDDIKVIFLTNIRTIVDKVR